MFSKSVVPVPAGTSSRRVVGLSWLEELGDIPIQVRPASTRDHCAGAPKQVDCLVIAIIRCGQTLLQLLLAALRGDGALGGVQKQTGGVVKVGCIHDFSSVIDVVSQVTLYFGHSNFLAGPCPGGGVGGSAQRRFLVGETLTRSCDAASKRRFA